MRDSELLYVWLLAPSACLILVNGASLLFILYLPTISIVSILFLECCVCKLLFAILSCFSIFFMHV